MTLLHTAAIGSIVYIGYMLLSRNRSRNMDVPCASEEAPIYVSVAGVSYNGRQEQISTCFPGQSLRLVRESSNPYDKNAIAVYADADQLGYVQQEVADELAVIMDLGICMTAKVEEVTGGGEAPYGLIIKVEKEKKQPVRNQ